MVLLILLILQIPLPPPTPPDGTTSTRQVLTTLDRAVVKLVASPDKDVRRLAESVRGDVATITNAVEREPVPAAYLAALKGSAESLDSLGTASQVDNKKLDSLRDLAEDLRIKAEAVRETPERVPAVPLEVPQAPIAMPSPRAPSKSLPYPGPSLTLPAAQAGGKTLPAAQAGGMPLPAAQSAHVIPQSLPDMPAPKPELRVVRGSWIEMADEVRFKLVNYSNSLLPNPQIPSKSVPAPSAVNRWMRSVRIMTFLRNIEQPGLDLYIISQLRALEKVSRAEIQMLGSSSFDGSLVYGNYVIIAAKGGLPKTVELSRFNPKSVKIVKQRAGSFEPQVIRIELDPAGAAPSPAGGGDRP